MTQFLFRTSDRCDNVFEVYILVNQFLSVENRCDSLFSGSKYLQTICFELEIAVTIFFVFQIAVTYFRELYLAVTRYFRDLNTCDTVFSSLYSSDPLFSCSK